MLEAEGRQNTRMMVSMASSEPTPQKKLDGVRSEGLEGGERRVERSVLSGCWWLCSSIRQDQLDLHGQVGHTGQDSGSVHLG